ncbi:MAG TPA: hypothetical protein VJJ01_02575 [Nitrosopumilaceae archaeon]|nr:hypothetical protein [Nitrosopumilaceae archaeon]
MKTKMKETRFEPKEFDFGERKVSRMNFSYIVTLPKKFVQNTQNGEIISVVKLIMLEDGSLKITPVCMKNEPTELTVM